MTTTRNKNAETFYSNLSPWLTPISSKIVGNGLVVKYSTTKDKIKIAGNIKKFADDCQAISCEIYHDHRIPGGMIVKVVFMENQMEKKMDEDTEFYYALLQQAGVKMVRVHLDKNVYTYLCTIDVKPEDTVVVQGRNMMMVGTVVEILDEWDMEKLEQHPDLSWVVNHVDVSNDQIYKNQKEEVFKKLRQSRLVEKAKIFAQNSNVNFEDLVQTTKQGLIEHVSSN